jgi:hypothetical protein
MSGKYRRAAAPLPGIVSGAEPTLDFTCSDQVLPPGRHTEAQVWAPVRAAIADPSTIGEVCPVFAEIVAGADAEMLSISGIARRSEW